jgi:alpha-L-rhamnosidase
VAESEYVRRWNDRGQLDAVLPRMKELLANMEQSIDAQGLYAPHGDGRVFVDWAKGFSADSPEARRALDFEYLLAFSRAAWLLRTAGDAATAGHYDALADRMLRAARAQLKGASGAYGDRWQTNAIAVLAGVVESDAERAAVWRVLSRAVGQREPDDAITPYYGSYLLSAMAELGHREEALAWMRSYWGGMLDAGATSFWETWDPAWAGADAHARLQADDKTGYYTSLAHGWSSGPAAWLAEQVLGVTVGEDARRTLLIRPDLAGLQWARGVVATSYGAVRVDVARDRVRLDVPHGVPAVLVLPAGSWMMNDTRVRGEVTLRRGGNYEFERVLR